MPLQKPSFFAKEIVHLFTPLLFLILRARAPSNPKTCLLLNQKKLDSALEGAQFQAKKLTLPSGAAGLARCARRWQPVCRPPSGFPRMRGVFRARPLSLA